MDWQFPILLAEDRDDDVLLIRKAFASAYIPNPLYVVKDGEEAIAYLAGERGYANRDEYPLPSLLLLDLKMPRIDGFEVLKQLSGFGEDPPALVRFMVLSATCCKRPDRSA